MTNTLIIIATAATIVVTVLVAKSLFKKIKSKRNRDEANDNNALNFDKADNAVETLESASDDLIEQLLNCKNSGDRATVTSKIYHHLHGISMTLGFLATDGPVSRLIRGDAAKRAQVNNQIESMRKRLIMCQDALNQALRQAMQATVED